MKTQRRFVPCPGAASLPAGFVVLCLFVLPVFGILTWTRKGVPFPCLCTVNILIANISMNEAFRHTRPPQKGVKKIAHAIYHLVSRKSVAKLQPPRKLTKYSEEKV